MLSAQNNDGDGQHFRKPNVHHQSASTNARAGTDDAGELDRWELLGFKRLGADDYETPVGLVVFEAHDSAVRTNLIKTMAEMGRPPAFVIKRGSHEQFVFALDDPSLIAVLKRSVLPGVHVLSLGDRIDLPDEAAWPSPLSFPSAAAGLSVISDVEVSRIATAAPNCAQPVVQTTPLSRMSLRGEAAEFRARAVNAEPLLSNLCFSGQVTTWYAAPNTGKTLIALSLLIDALREGRVAGGNVYYINADDGSEGMASKMELLDVHQVHTLIPGHKGFKNADLAPLLETMGSLEQAKGVFVIVDTTKKFVSLMDKRDATAFGNACRRVAMSGGAVLNLAHTTKNPNTNGSPRYTGTTDLVEDSDAVYTIRKLEEATSDGEHFVEFECKKMRGPNAEKAAYAYDGSPTTDYVERLLSVRRVEDVVIDQFKRVEAEREDAELIDITRKCIVDGHNAKMTLVKEVAHRAGVSGRQALRLIERYTGTDPQDHRWLFTIGPRGVHRFELLQAAA